MARGPAKQLPSEFSYEMYQELLEELLSPIESSLDPDIRYELYLSKLVYLENLHQQCFRSINSKSENLESSYTQDDLKKIQDAIDSTHNFVRNTIREALSARLSADRAQ